MAITTIAALATPNAVAEGATTRFTTTGPFWFYGDNLNFDDQILLYRLGPSGSYKIMTNAEGPIFLSKNPNSAYIPGGGSFSASKIAGSSTPSIGYEEV